MKTKGRLFTVDGGSASILIWFHSEKRMCAIVCLLLAFYPSNTKSRIVM